jgi:hypothetical protein
LGGDAKIAAKEKGAASDPPASFPPEAQRRIARAAIS